MKRILSFLLVFILVATSAIAVSAEGGAENDVVNDGLVTYVDGAIESMAEIEADDGPPNSAMFGTPTLGTNDPLWQTTVEIPITRSSLGAADPRRGVTTGVGRVLWDEDFLYARIVVTDNEVFTGAGAANQHMHDSIEFYLGAGSQGANQWRVSAVGTLSGQNAPGREAWTTITDTGYIVEMRIPRRTVTFTNNSPITFEIGINNSTAIGNDRFEVITAFGTPDAAWGSSASFTNSLMLVGDPGITRHRIDASAGANGTITPSGLVRVPEGTNQTFTLTPIPNFLVDTVTVDGNAVTVTDNSFTFVNVTGNHTIHVTFMQDPDALELDFIVWNDSFATGEFTTAVIIDLGEGREMLASDLDDEMFTVIGRNVRGTAVFFEGVRDIARVYLNDEPSVRGYSGRIYNSPGFSEGLSSGRYIVIEFDIGFDGGVGTADGANSTDQVYSVITDADIVLSDETVLDKVIFVQTAVVNPVISQFEIGPTLPGVNFTHTRYIHRDADGNPQQNLPLFIYIHGMNRGGTVANVFNPLRTANGGTALVSRIMENPVRYASHIIVPRATTGQAVIRAHVDSLIDQGLVDPNRIYISGFSMGGSNTHAFINHANQRGFVAAAAPLAPVGGYPTRANIVGNENMAYWAFVNTFDAPSYEAGARTFATGGNGGMQDMTNARVSLYRDVNTAFVWPFSQNAPTTRPPDLWLGPTTGHELEAAILYNRITETHFNWNIEPTFQAPGMSPWAGQFQDLFDWMFSQSLAGEMLPQALTVTGGSGSGVFTENTIVTISADVEEGYVFNNWTFSEEVVFVDGYSLNSETVRFFMPSEPLNVTANFAVAILPRLSAISMWPTTGTAGFNPMTTFELTVNNINWNWSAINLVSAQVSDEYPGAEVLRVYVNGVNQGDVSFPMGLRLSPVGRTITTTVIEVVVGGPGFSERTYTFTYNRAAAPPRGIRRNAYHAIADLAPNNSTTAQDVFNAVSAAMEGVEGVTVTGWCPQNPFELTPATPTTAGMIRGRLLLGADRPNWLPDNYFVWVNHVFMLLPEDLSPYLGATAIRDLSSPTGYTVRFVFNNPDAAIVYFEGFLYLRELANEMHHLPVYDWPEPADMPFYHPTEFRPGLFPAETWWSTQLGPFAAADRHNYMVPMVYHGDGYWVVHYPLPAGVNPYWYRANAPGEALPTDGPGRRQPDPNNVFEAFGTLGGNTRAVRNEAYSVAHVPFDPDRQHPIHEYRAWELPRIGQNGTVDFYTLNIGAAQRHMGVYLPYGHDVNRAEAYPVIFLRHGGGGDQADWMYSGAAINIMDNLIAEGLIEPVIVVTLLGGGTEIPQIRDVIIPHIVENYNARPDALGRAHMGLSAGAAFTGTLWQAEPLLFGFYGMLSGGSIGQMMAPGQSQLLQDRLWPTILAGYGVNEPLRGRGGNFQSLTSSLLTNNIDFIHMAVPGGHDWHAYALMLTLTMKYHLNEWPDPMPNKDELGEVLAEARPLDQSNFSAANWRLFAAARNNAQMVYDNIDSTQAEVYNAVNNLRNLVNRAFNIPN